ncbi:MAG: carbohydrate kinase [Acidobacteriaceae bacterium]|nr:carbohydrate kinase [Acidobacteriaceae bacterium]
MNITEAVWIGIDVGTQSIRAIAADDTGSVLATSTKPLLSSQRAGPEHVQDPEEWWGAVCASCQEIMSEVPAHTVGAIAVDATSGTVLLTDNNLRPVTEALMYDDGRAEGEARAIAEVGGALWAEFGYRIQPSWGLPKLLWLWHNRVRNTTGLRLTHQNDFIQNRLAGERISTDWSNTLKSGYDLLRQQWPHSVFEKLGLPDLIFPQVVPPGSLVGQVSRDGARQTGLPAGLPIIAGMTDGCAAQIAAGSVQRGNWNSVLGTTLVVKGVTEERLHDPLGVVYSHRAPDRNWLPGGASSTGAGSIAKHFRRENLDQLGSAAATRGPSPAVVYPLHASGERFPFAAPQAQSFGLDKPRDEVELYRAILQGVAFVERLSFDYLELLGAPLSGVMSISGGAVRSSLWNQIRADVLGRTLTVPAVMEPAFGMAVLASSHTSSLPNAAARMISSGSTIEPALPFGKTYGETYCKLLRELEGRGWLPSELASYSVARIDV